MEFHHKMSFEEYLRLNYLLFFRKGTTIFIMGIGLLMLITVLLYYSGLVPGLFSGDKPPYFQMIFALATLVIIPLTVYFSVSKLYHKTNTRLQEEIEYRISESTLSLKGSSFSTEIDWDKMYKIKELKEWFLAYQQPGVFFQIPKNGLDAGQIEYIRGVFRKVEDVEIELK